jgi:anti-sigma B factor antagonist
MDLGLSISQRGEVPVLAITGEVDLATVPRLRDQLVRIASDHPGVPVVADLDGVTFIDSTGLGVLVGAQRRIGGAASYPRRVQPAPGRGAVDDTPRRGVPDPCHAVGAVASIRVT